MISIPKRVEKLLSKDEFIEREFNVKKRFPLRRCRVFASNFQLFIEENNGITKIPYEYISGIELKRKLNILLIILGILHSLAGALLF